MRWMIQFGILMVWSSFSLGAVYQDPQSGLSLSYDEALWETSNNKVASQETVLNLQRKIPDKEGDTTYFSRLSIVRDDMSKIKKVQESKLPPLQAYQVHAIDFLKSQRFDIVSSELKKSENIPGGIFEIIANQRDFGLTYQQVGLIKNGQAYLITATVRTKKFSEYRSDLEKMFQSVKLIP